jgi:hypothetical protein
MHVSHTVAQAVIRRLSIAAARVRTQDRSCGIYGGQSGTGAGFLLVLGFITQIFSPPSASYLSTIRHWYNMPLKADVLRELSLTAPHKIEK